MVTSPNLNVTQFLTQDSNLNRDLSETDVELQLVSKISSPLFWAHSLGFPKKLFWFLLLVIKRCSFTFSNSQLFCQPGFYCWS